VPGQRVLSIALIILGWTAVAASKDIALVSHKANAVTTVTLPELVKICKGQSNRWPDGKPLTFITRDPGSPDMKLVLEKVYGMSKAEVAEVISTANHGRLNHPAILVVPSDASVVERVESTPGAIGLVDVYSITGGIKVVRVSGKLPLEPGYPLHGN
jgi:ABC-type phosphate transport system substrate-binding protein